MLAVAGPSLKRPTVGADASSFGGADRVWAQQIVDLRDYAGKAVEIAFYLSSDNGTVSTRAVRG
jgi:hypothetical protein